MKRYHILYGLIACIFLMFASTAQAYLMFDQIVDMNGTGFGNVLSVLALQETGTAGTATDVEQGKVFWNGSSDGYVDPLTTIVYGDNKTATRTIADLGWQDASEVRIIVNMNEQGGAVGQFFRIDDLMMTIYADDGSVLWPSGVFTPYLPGTLDQGLGGSGIAFKLSPDQVLTLNSLVAGIGTWGDITSYRVGLASTISFVDDGPDNLYAARGPGASPVPEPATMLLLGSGLVGLAGFRRKFKKS